MAKEIIGELGSAPKSGCIVVLTGLSGTGKTTTVCKLQAALPNAASWSNGNVFRALTLLAATHCEKFGLELCEETLSADLLEQLMVCLEFGKFDGRFDTKIAGYGYDCCVSQVADTLLKEPKVSKNVPTVAEMTQGEVVKFAAQAAEQMQADGMNVLMEGRSQTLNYIRTPHRFELTLPEPVVISMRRAARHLTGACDASDTDVSAKAEVERSLRVTLATLLASPVAKDAFGEAAPLTWEPSLLRSVIMFAKSDLPINWPGLSFAVSSCFFACCMTVAAARCLFFLDADVAKELRSCWSKGMTCAPTRSSQLSCRIPVSYPCPTTRWH